MTFQDDFGDEHDNTLSPFQKQEKRVLEVIGDLEPDRGTCVSETAVFVRTAPTTGLKEHRDVVRTAFEMIQDRGFCRRQHQHWKFQLRFRRQNVAGLLLWVGTWVPTSSNYASNQR